MVVNGYGSKDYSREKQGRKKTGGGQQPASQSNQSTSIINLFGDEPSAEDALVTFEG